MKWVVTRHLGEVGETPHEGCIVAGGGGLTESSEDDILKLSQKETRIKHTYMIYRQRERERKSALTFSTSIGGIASAALSARPVKFGTCCKSANTFSHRS